MLQALDGAPPAGQFRRALGAPVQVLLDFILRPGGGAVFEVGEQFFVTWMFHKFVLLFSPAVSYVRGGGIHGVEFSFLPKVGSSKRVSRARPMATRVLTVLSARSSSSAISRNFSPSQKRRTRTMRKSSSSFSKALRTSSH